MHWREATVRRTRRGCAPDPKILLAKSAPV